jgi:hypothetical protein
MSTAGVLRGKACKYPMKANSEILTLSFRLSSLAIPLSTQLLFAQGAVVISTSAAGHLGSWELSVTALAQSFFNVMGEPSVTDIYHGNAISIPGLVSK